MPEVQVQYLFRQTSAIPYLHESTDKCINYYKRKKGKNN